MLGEKIKQVSILITSQEEALWLEFRRQQENIGTLIKSGALDIKQGKFTCHMGSGRVQKIAQEVTLFTL